MGKYKLFKGFLLIGEFNSISEAKKEAPKEDGVYNLLGDGYRDSWQILKGVIYNGDAQTTSARKSH
jgi:long-subunit fatty acid transport protein